MAELVNLRRFRKARLRAAAEVVAAQHRLTYGESRKEGDARAAEAGRALRRLDQHRLTSLKSTAPEGDSADD